MATALLRMILAGVLLLTVDSVSLAQMVRVTSSSSTEAKLAVIDAKSSSVPQSTIRVYGRLLDQADAKCPEERTMVADMAVRGTQLLEENGRKISVLGMLRAINESLAGEAASLGIQCSEVVAALVVMMSPS